MAFTATVAFSGWAPIAADKIFICGRELVRVWLKNTNKEHYSAVDFETELEKLQDELLSLAKVVSSIQGVLDIPVVMSNKLEAWPWLKHLRRAMIDAELTWDELASELKRPTHELMSRSGQFNSILDVVAQLTKVRGKLERISTDIASTNLNERVGRVIKEMWEKVQSSSHVQLNRVFGRVKETGCLVRTVTIICILGVVGIGKTTLVQLVYNEERIIKSFDMRIWIYVGHTFDGKSMTRSIISYVKRRLKQEPLGEANDLDTLQHELRTLLAGKKILIVLDGITHTRRADWDAFRASLGYGVVLVTTRLCCSVYS